MCAILAANEKIGVEKEILQEIENQARTSTRRLTHLGVSQFVKSDQINL
jgi:hypothetical protein